jgi:hypothetical protein
MFAADASSRDKYRIGLFKMGVEFALEAVNVMLEGKNGIERLADINEKVVQALTHKESYNKPAKALPNHNMARFFYTPKIKDKVLHHDEPNVVLLKGE